MGRGFCGAMGNDASRVTVVDVCRGSLVRARVWARGRSKVILLHIDRRSIGLKHPNVTPYSKGFPMRTAIEPFKVLDSVTV